MAPHNNKIISWSEAETLMRQGVVRCMREFSLHAIAQIVNPAYTITENLNKIFYLSRVPWSRQRQESAERLSLRYPVYMIADDRSFTLKMHKCVVSSARSPGAIEFRYFGYIIRRSMPITDKTKSMTLYAGPHTDDSVRSKINLFYHLLDKQQQEDNFLYENSNK